MIALIFYFRVKVYIYVGIYYYVWCQNVIIIIVKRKTGWDVGAYYKN